MRPPSALEEASLPLQNVFAWVQPRRNSKVVNDFVVHLLVDVRSRCVTTTHLHPSGKAKIHPPLMVKGLYYNRANKIFIEKKCQYRIIFNVIARKP